MPETTQETIDNCLFRAGASRLWVLACMVLLPAVYTYLTLYGSFDFLLNKAQVIRLTVSAKAPIYTDGIGAFGGAINLPDDWRFSSQSSNARRYAFEFDLPHALQEDQEIYLPQVADNVRATVNGEAQPFYGNLEGLIDLHWSAPLVFAVPATAFRLGRNELLIDVYANESLLGSLPSVSIGPRGAFDSHRLAMAVSKRGLAYVLLGLDLFAILALALYAVAVSGRFYFVSVGICVSTVGGLLPHILATPPLSIGAMFCAAIVSFLMLQSCFAYLCSLLFSIDQKVLKLLYAINGINVFLLCLLPFYVASHEQLVQLLIGPCVLIEITGGTMTILLTRQYLKQGETAVGLVLFLAFFIMALGTRDILVVWTWLPSHQGFYILHGLGVMVLCLAGLIALRIRTGVIEQARYQATVREALAIAKKASMTANPVSRDQSLDALVSRIATTYSHEFRNPLAAALATNKLMMTSRWSSDGQVALCRIQRSILCISDALDQQFDFQRTMQGTGETFTDTELPAWLSFSAEFRSCKIIWLSDPHKVPPDGFNKAEEWLRPLLREFEGIPSVCLVHQQKNKLELHLYLHLAHDDALGVDRQYDDDLIHLKPLSRRDTEDGQYLYWRYEH